MYGLGAMSKPSDKEVPVGPSDEGPAPTPRPPAMARPEPSEPAEPMRAAPPRPSEARAARQLPPQLERFKDLLVQLGGTSKAKIVGSDDNIAAEVPVRELVETLKNNGKGAKAVVFDGIIKQRALDIASEIGLKAVVGTKMGTVTKQPAGIEVLTRDDLS